MSQNNVLSLVCRRSTTSLLHTPVTFGMSQPWVTFPFWKPQNHYQFIYQLFLLLYLSGSPSMDFVDYSMTNSLVYGFHILKLWEPLTPWFFYFLVKTIVLTFMLCKRVIPYLLFSRVDRRMSCNHSSCKFICTLVGWWWPSRHSIFQPLTFFRRSYSSSCWQFEWYHVFVVT